MMSRALIVLMLSVAVAPACAGLRIGKADTDAGQAHLEQLLAAKGRPEFVTTDSEGTRLWKRTREFYARRDNRLAWTVSMRCSAAVYCRVR